MAPSGRGWPAQSSTIPSPRSMRSAEAGAAFLATGHGCADFRPWLLGGQGLPAMADHRVEMRAFLHERFGKRPEPPEGVIGQPQASVGTEHGHALREGIEGFALHAQSAH